MIAVTIGVGPFYGEMARLAAERVRTFTGLPTLILGDEAYRSHVDARHIAAIGPMASTALKTRLFELCPDYDDILYFDADLVFLAPWDPRAFAGTERFVCVRDSWYLDFIQAEAARLGVPCERYFNAGFFIASREAHAGILAESYRRFAECYERGYGLFDQGLLNLVFHEHGLPLHCSTAATTSSAGRSTARSRARSRPSPRTASGAAYAALTRSRRWPSCRARCRCPTRLRVPSIPTSRPSSAR